MRIFILILSALLAWSQLSAREVVNINRNWRFFSDSEGSSDHAVVVNLPHSWNTDAYTVKDYWRGECSYSYTPSVLLSVEGTALYQEGPEAVVEGYMRAFDDAMTNADFSAIYKTV